MGCTSVNERSPQAPPTSADVLPPPGPVRPAAAFFDAVWFLDYLFAKQPTFRYINRGAMASMGSGGGIVDSSQSDIAKAPALTGFAAFVAWRGAYLSKQVSVQNMILIPMFWCASVSKKSRRWRGGVRFDLHTGLRAGSSGETSRASKLFFLSQLDTNIHYTRSLPAGRTPRRPSTGTGPSSPCRRAAIISEALLARRP